MGGLHSELEKECSVIARKPWCKTCIKRRTSFCTVAILGVRFSQLLAASLLCQLTAFVRAFIAMSGR